MTDVAVQTRILLIKRVSPFAMRLTGVGICDAMPTTDVFTRSDRLKMGGINAWWIAAKVIKMHPWRNRANKSLIGKPIGGFLLAVAHIHLPVSFRSFIAKP